MLATVDRLTSDLVALPPSWLAAVVALVRVTRSLCIDLYGFDAVEYSVWFRRAYSPAGTFTSTESFRQMRGLDASGISLLRFASVSFRSLRWHTPLDDSIASGVNAMAYLASLLYELGWMSSSQAFFSTVAPTLLRPAVLWDLSRVGYSITWRSVFGAWASSSLDFVMPHVGGADGHNGQKSLMLQSLSWGLTLCATEVRYGPSRRSVVDINPD